MPVPKTAALARAESALKEIFKTELEQATSNEQQIALAASLLTQGIKSKGDPAEKYALLQTAANLASAAGDLNLAFEATAAIANAFQVEVSSLNVELLTRLLKAAGSDTARKSLLVVASQLIEPALLAGDYDGAKKLAAAALAAARATSDTENFKAFSSLTKDVDEAERARARANVALKLLEKQPSSKSANLEVGRYRCFFEGNFTEGLPMLEQGTDQKLAAIAQLELADPQNPQARLKLADEWWELARREKGIARKNIERHAVHWYQLASADLDGLLKAKAEKRIADAGGIASEPPRVVINRNAAAPAVGAAPQAGSLFAALAALKPAHFDNFDNPQSGFPETSNPDFTAGYKNGVFRVETLTNRGVNTGTRTPWTINGADHGAAIRVMARCSGTNAPRWGVTIANMERKQGVSIDVLTQGQQMGVGVGFLNFAGPTPRSLPAPTILEGNALNTLVVLVKGRYIEAYINGELIGEPFVIEQDLWPAQCNLRYYCSGPATFDFEEIAIWPAKDLPVLRPDLVR